MLAFEISVKTDKEDEDCNGNKGRSERFTDLAKMIHCRMIWISFSYTSVESEELSDSNTDTGKRE